MKPNSSKWWQSGFDSNMTKKQYSNISIPEGLKAEIEKLFNKLEKNNIDLGYSSYAEFTKDAIRRLIVQIREAHLKR